MSPHALGNQQPSLAPPLQLPLQHQQQENLQSRMALLLSATLELWCHQLLYVRQVYPRNTFTSTNVWDLDKSCCYVQRHTAVVQYISNAIQMAVPTLLAGMADQFSLILVEQQSDNGNSVELERYTLHVFDLMPTLFVSKQFPESVALEKEQWNDQQRQQQHDDWCRIERAMRNLVLQVHASCCSRTTTTSATSHHPPQQRKGMKSPNLTFKILLHILPLEPTDAATPSHTAATTSNHIYNHYHHHRRNRGFAKQLIQQGMAEGRWWSNPSPQQLSYLPSSAGPTTITNNEEPNHHHHHDGSTTTCTPTRRLLARPLYQLDQGGLRINFVAHVLLSDETKTDTNHPPLPPQAI